MRLIYRYFIVVLDNERKRNGLCIMHPAFSVPLHAISMPLKVLVDGNATIHLRPHARHVAGVLSHRPARPAPTSENAATLLKIQSAHVG